MAGLVPAIHVGPHLSIWSSAPRPPRRLCGA